VRAYVSPGRRSQRTAVLTGILNVLVGMPASPEMEKIDGLTPVTNSNRLGHVGKKPRATNPKISRPTLSWSGNRGNCRACDSLGTGSVVDARINYIHNLFRWHRTTVATAPRAESAGSTIHAEAA
jgi:hypothetical protein